MPIIQPQAQQAKPFLDLGALWAGLVGAKKNGRTYQQTVMPIVNDPKPTETKTEPTQSEPKTEAKELHYHPMTEPQPMKAEPKADDASFTEAPKS